MDNTDLKPKEVIAYYYFVETKFIIKIVTDFKEEIDAYLLDKEELKDIQFKETDLFYLNKEDTNIPIEEVQFKFLIYNVT